MRTVRAVIVMKVTGPNEKTIAESITRKLTKKEAEELADEILDLGTYSLTDEGWLHSFQVREKEDYPGEGLENLGKLLFGPE